MKDILNELIVGQEQLYNELMKKIHYDRANVLPGKSYKGNISKEMTEEIIDHFIDREFDKISKIEFPATIENAITLDKCNKELENIMIKDRNWKTPSNIVRYFHKSLVKANIEKHLSPYEGWQLIRSDKEVFRKFYANRLRCSDWFKEKDNLKYLGIGFVPEFIYGIGLSTSRSYQNVTYFKPDLAKYIISKYLNEYDTIFDPFSGYSGRMIGAFACGKSYIGQDICKSSVKESNDIIKWISGSKLSVTEKNIIGDSGKYDCLFTCSPYENIEEWPGVEKAGKTCDEWIDICLNNYDCSKYVFVTDDRIVKYKGYAKESLVNTSHFGSNEEYIVVITKDARNNILNGNINTEAETIETKTNEFTVKPASKTELFSQLGMNLYNIFNTEYFKRYVCIPAMFTDFVKMIYDKFELSYPEIETTCNQSAVLEKNDNVVVLSFSGGLDSCYQALSLKDKGYEVILFHMKNANRYEGGQGTKVAKEFAEKNNMQYVEAQLSNGDKFWPENPIKNQMILCSIIDYCIDNDYNNISLGETLVLTISEVVKGINVTDSKDVSDAFISVIKQMVRNVNFIEVEGHPSKYDKIKKLEDTGNTDYYYSCLQPGRFVEMRHNNAESKFGIKLPKHNCGCSCRKCATQNLIKHYSEGGNVYPQEFIDRCWKVMYDNSYSSEYRFFSPDIPLEQRIKNLWEQ